MEATANHTNAILLIGIGNTTRGDDGLGWALAEAVEALQLPGVTVVYRQQLQVEDALLLQQYPIVVFADASVEPVPGGAALQPCIAAAQSFASSHHQSPATLLYLAKVLYGAQPQAWVLALQAASFELQEGLHAAARNSLQEGLRCWNEWWAAQAAAS